MGSIPDRPKRPKDWTVAIIEDIPVVTPEEAEIQRRKIEKANRKRQRAQMDIEIEKARRLAEIEIDKARQIAGLNKGTQPTNRPASRSRLVNGDKIRKLRGDKSQELFAERCGVSVSTIQRAEH